MSLDVSASDNGRTNEDLPDNIFVEMTLESRSEEVTKVFPLRKTGDSYISEAVDMPLGAYTLKEFVVDNEDLAATPGMLQNFSVASNDRKNISIGKVAFRSRGAHPLLIAVYTEGEKTKLTNAKVTVFDHEQDRYMYDRSGKINQVIFKGNSNVSYTLKIEKEGYEVYTLSFTYGQLSKKRLAITLQEKATEGAITFQPNATYFSIWIFFTGKGTVVLDWGTGGSETIDFDVDPEDETGTGFAAREQEYENQMPPGKITGDIHLVTGFFFDSMIHSVNLEEATALTNFI